MRILKIILIGLIVTVVVTSIFQLTSSLGFALSLCPIFISIIILGYERALMFPGIRLEFLIETQFFLAGVISFLWILVT
jgi:4-hydroxy-3-methylbut-2-enyl diphosphate reductase